MEPCNNCEICCNWNDDFKHCNDDVDNCMHMQTELNRKKIIGLGELIKKLNNNVQEQIKIVKDAAFKGIETNNTQIAINMEQIEANMRDIEAVEKEIREDC
ncbi:MAG: hypothetical protein GY845_25710 [Planctomycetes bacterium]|nr:hypothetical protein [Planctomycetota bacterium]